MPVEVLCAKALAGWFPVPVEIDFVVAFADSFTRGASGMVPLELEPVCGDRASGMQVEEGELLVGESERSRPLRRAETSAAGGQRVELVPLDVGIAEDGLDAGILDLDFQMPAEGEGEAKIVGCPYP